jgi:archaellum biogenesis ATPase FlaH
MQNIQIQKRRGRPAKVKNVTYIPSVIDFKDITPLNELAIDPKMMESMPSGLNVDKLMSHEGGIPCATNIMCIGDPGVGKTTVLLDILASVQLRGRKCLFISGEMGKKQMFKYTERFKQFGVVQTLFMQDYLEYNTKDVIEQVLDKGWDLVLIDSAAEVIEGVRDDNNWDRKMAESWLVDICCQNNKGENKINKYTSFLLIQQVTKSGVFQGSNKLKHMMDAMMEMRRESDKDGGATYTNYKVNAKAFTPSASYFFGDYIGISGHNNVIRPIWMQMTSTGSLTVYTAIIDPTIIGNYNANPANVSVITAMPNPFKAETSIDFYIAKKSELTIQLVDNTGKIISVIYNKKMLPEGTNTLTLNANQLNLVSGIYYVVFYDEEQSKYVKLIVE